MGRLSNLVKRYTQKSHVFCAVFSPPVNGGSAKASSPLAKYRLLRSHSGTKMSLLWGVGRAVCHRFSLGIRWFGQQNAVAGHRSAVEARNQDPRPLFPATQGRANYVMLHLVYAAPSQCTAVNGNLRRAEWTRCTYRLPWDRCRSI